MRNWLHINWDIACQNQSDQGSREKHSTATLRRPACDEFTKEGTVMLATGDVSEERVINDN